MGTTLSGRIWEYRKAESIVIDYYTFGNNFYDFLSLIKVYSEVGQSR